MCSAADIAQPKVFAGKLAVGFDKLVNENGRIVASGRLTYDGKAYLLSKSVFVLQSETNEYLFAAQNALNGQFFGSIDTSALAPSVYQLSIAGGVVEGNDTAGKAKMGHVLTGYKITVPAAETQAP